MRAVNKANIIARLNKEQAVKLTQLILKAVDDD